MRHGSTQDPEHVGDHQVMVPAIIPTALPTCHQAVPAMVADQVDDGREIVEGSGINLADMLTCPVKPGLKQKILDRDPTVELPPLAA